MPDPVPPKPVPAQRPAAEQARRDREAAALRDNLKRRKEQARARQDPPQKAPGPDLGLPPDPEVG